MVALCLALGFLFGGASCFISNQPFPKNFKFGTATSSYQIEGGWNEGGKSESIWDMFTHEHPEWIRDGNNGDIACDSYHRYKEDIELLKRLGVNTYRFSLSWTRLFPMGTVNYVNQEGVDYYRRILKLLEENDIEPLVTIYHWDLPSSLNELGGWANPLMAQYFADYAEMVFRLFGHSVRTWFTINEPNLLCVLGYTGVFAPGYNQPAEGPYLCSITVLKAHAMAYHIYHEKFRSTQNGRVSIVLASYWAEPKSRSEDDLLAQQLFLQFEVGLYAHPIYHGNWPDLVIDRVATRSKMEGYPRSRLPPLTDEEVIYIKGTIDFFSMNYYSTRLVTLSCNDSSWCLTSGISRQNPSYEQDVGVSTNIDPRWKQSNSTASWLYQVPWGLRHWLRWIHEEYNSPEILITENGWAENGSSLDDQDRIEYMQLHLNEVLGALYVDQINISGYTCWSLLDNFEWDNGYTPKFGLVSVDFNSVNRIRRPKKSYSWYKELIRTKCLSDACQSDEDKKLSVFMI